MFQACIDQISVLVAKITIYLETPGQNLVQHFLLSPYANHTGLGYLSINFPFGIFPSFFFFLLQLIIH